MSLNRLAINFFFIVLVSSISCRKDQINSGVTPDPDPAPGVSLEQTMTGELLAEDMAPIGSQLIQTSKNMLLTNDDGFFTFKELIDRDNFLLKFSDVYYFEAFQHSKLADVGSLHLRAIQPKLLGGGWTFQAQKGEKIDFQNGVKIEIDPNSFVDQNNQAYSGTVRVFSKWYDPADPNTSRTVPTNLQAINRDGSDGLLSPYAFLSIEFRNISNQKLSLTKAVLLEVPTSISIESQTKDIVKSFYIDESISAWKEESTATKMTNAKYQFKSLHPSMLAVAENGKYAALQGNILIDQSPVIIYGRIKDELSGFFYDFTTNNTGKYRVFVPENKQLSLVIFNECGSELYTIPLGAYSGLQATAPEVYFQSEKLYTILNAKIIDCNSLPNTQAYLKIQSPSNDYFHILPADSLGQVKALVDFCTSASLNCTPVDYKNKITGNIKNINSGILHSELTLEVCDQSNLFGMTVHYGNLTKHINNIKVSRTADTTAETYLFEALDDDGNGNQVSYGFAFARPKFSSEYFFTTKIPTIIGNPGDLFYFSTCGTSEAKSTGKSSKEIVHFILDACSIEEKKSGKTYSGKIILKAEIP